MTKDEAKKLLIGYLVSGNSAHDLAEMFVDMAYENPVAEIKETLKEIEESDQVDTKEYWLQSYKEVLETRMSLLAG